MQDFWKEHNFIPVDARYGGVPVAIAAEMFGGKPKRQRPAKRWTWEDCRALAKVLNVMLGRSEILFEGGITSFENNKAYGYRNASQCYESLLCLHRDRLSRLSDDEAIANGQQAKEFF